MIELIFLKEFDVFEGIWYLIFLTLILIKTGHQKRVVFVTIGIFLHKRFKFQPCVCNVCHDLLIVSMNLSNIAILKMKNVDYYSIVSGVSKLEAIKLSQNIDLTEKNKLFKIY